MENKKKRTDLSYFSPVVLVFNEWKRNLTLHHSTCARRKYENINYGINIHSLPITVSSPVLYVFFNNPVIYINPQYRSNRRVMYVATLTFPAGLREEVERFPVSSVRSTLRCLFPLWNELLYYSFFVSYFFFILSPFYFDPFTPGVMCCRSNKNVSQLLLDLAFSLLEYHFGYSLAFLSIVFYIIVAFSPFDNV